MFFFSLLLPPPLCPPRVPVPREKVSRNCTRYEVALGVSYKTVTNVGKYDWRLFTTVVRCSLQRAGPFTRFNRDREHRTIVTNSKRGNESFEILWTMTSDRARSLGYLRDSPIAGIIAPRDFAANQHRDGLSSRHGGKFPDFLFAFRYCGNEATFLDPGHPPRESSAMLRSSVPKASVLDLVDSKIANRKCLPPGNHRYRVASTRNNRITNHRGYLGYRTLVFERMFAPGLFPLLEFKAISLRTETSGG